MWRFRAGTLALTAWLAATPAIGADGPLASDEVEVYEHRDFIGRSHRYRLPAGQLLLAVPYVGDDLNDRISSVRLGEEVILYFFEDALFGRESDTKAPWVPAATRTSATLPPIIDDETSSLVLVRGGADAGTPPGIQLVNRLQASFVGGALTYQRYLPIPAPAVGTECHPALEERYLLPGSGEVRIELSEIDALALYPRSNDRVVVTLYDGERCSGESLRFPGPDSYVQSFDLDALGWDGRVRSVRVTYDGPLAAPSQVHTSAPPVRGPAWIEGSTNRPGGDLKSFWTPRNDHFCREACATDQECKAYTYFTPGASGDPSQGRCHLKASVPPAVSDLCCVSGVKPAEPPPTLSALPLPGTVQALPVEPSTAAAATPKQPEAILGTKVLETSGSRVVFEVRYRVDARRTGPVLAGGWLLAGGDLFGGYTPAQLPGTGEGTVRLAITVSEARTADAVEVFLFEPSHEPFLVRRAPFHHSFLSP